MRAAKRHLLHYTLVAATVVSLTCSRPPGPLAAEDVVRLPAVADVWLSDANPKERDTNSGKYPRLKLKNIQEMALVRFDASAVRGREVRRAKLFLRRAGRDKLRYIRVSTVNQDWVEGSSRTPYGPATGATFLYADGRPDARRPWAWPGSSLADVIMTSGNSLACWAPRRELPGGWISVELDPRLVYAMAAGDSDGLAVMDGGNPANWNNFVYSSEARGSEPYIEVRLGKSLSGVPAEPRMEARAAPERANFGRGAIRLAIEPQKNVFCWQIKLDGRAVQRWRVKHPAPEKTTVFYLDDLAPEKAYRLDVVAVSPGGRRSPPARQTVTSSPGLSKGIALERLEPPATRVINSPTDGPLRVWALPGLVKISPTAPKAMFGTLVSGDSDSPANSRPNAVWDGKRIKLFGARGEYVSYQLCIENLGDGPLQHVRVRPHQLKGPGEAPIGQTEIELYKNWYARNGKGQWQPAYSIPIQHGAPLAIPDPKRRLPKQQNQTVYVDLYIPKDAGPGDYAGSVAVEADGRREVVLPVTLRVFDFLLPDRLSFWPELNAYRIPKYSHDYYRLAHQHRCVLNCVGWKPKLEGSGKDIRVVWDEYDRRVGPLLTGRVMAENRRAGVPVECMYLPYWDSWPTSLSKQTYRYDGHWPARGEDPSHLVNHYLNGPYIGDGLSREYREAFWAVQRQFIEHFRAKGYTQTEMQCFYGGKATHRIHHGANMWWTTDEPYHWDDWLALQFFCRLWTEGRGRADPRIWTARADISRPQWQGRVLQGAVNEVYYAAGSFSKPAMARRCRTLAQQTRFKLRTYGSANRDDAGNTQSVAALLSIWVDGADAFLPWQTLGSEKALDENDRGAGGGNALLVPGARFQRPVVADMRLKALRDGQQLIEYLVLLGRKHDLNRRQIKAMIQEAVRLEARARPGAGVDNAGAVQFGTLSAWQISELRRRVAEWIVR